jgi:hypothetical protein
MHEHVERFGLFSERVGPLLVYRARAIDPPPLMTLLTRGLPL